jgi:membrane protein
VTSYALSASRGLVGSMPGSVNAVVDLLQFGLLAAAITGLYHYVPNTAVRWPHAWGGGVFVAVAFEVAKKALAWYVDTMGTFSAVYGSFATLPILLLWIYLGWVIVLLGAVIAAYAPSLQMRVVRRTEEAGSRFNLALELLAQMHAARTGLRRGVSLHEMALSLRQDPLQIEPVLDSLLGLGWVVSKRPTRSAMCCWRAQLLPLQPLIEALLLAPRGRSAGLAERSGLNALTLADALQGSKGLAT